LELLGRPVPSTAQRRFASWKLWGGTLWQYLLQIRYLLSHFWSRRSLAGPHRAEGRLLEAVRAYSRLPRLYLILHNDGRLAKYVGLCALNLAKASGSSTELARAYINPSAGLALTPPPAFFLNVLAPLADNIYGRWAREMARRSKDRPTLGYVLKLTSLYNVITGQWEEGRKAAEEARGIFQDLQDWYEEIECVSVLAQIAYFKGELADALQMRTAAYTMAHERGASFQQAWARVWRGTILLRLGRTEEAVPSLEESCTMLAEGRDRLHRLPGYGLLALAYWRLGKPQRAWEAAQLVVQRAEDLSLAYTLLPGAASVAEVSLALWEACSYPLSPERKAFAESAWKTCRALRYTRRLPIGRPSAWLWQGVYAWLAGKPSQARTAWQKSLRAAERLAMPYEQGLAHYELGRHLGADEPARQVHLRRACNIFTRLHAAYDLGRAQQVLETR